MKNLKLRTILLVFCMLLATGLSGCSKSSSDESADETQQTVVSEESGDVTSDTSESEAPVETAATEESEAPDETIQTSANMPVQNPANEALLAYKEVLKAAPPIEGDADELYDASFDYEQNYELFGDHVELFALRDLNQDEIPELITLSVVNFRWTTMSIYTFAEGEAVLVENQVDAGVHGSLEQMSTANGSYITYFCEDNHIHNLWFGTNPMGEEEEEGCAYAMDGATLTAVDCPIESGPDTTNFYDIALENIPANVDSLGK